MAMFVQQNILRLQVPVRARQGRKGHRETHAYFHNQNHAQVLVLVQRLSQKKQIGREIRFSDLFEQFLLTFLIWVQPVIENHMHG